MLARFIVLAGLLPAAALAAHAEWSTADQSQLRLLLVSAEQRGRLEGGVEIVLEPGWYTYWRNPGEAGVPPEFDFSDSENVAAVEVAYPAPERHDDGVSVSLIYRDEVVFPLTVTPIDAEKAVTLSVQAKFGVCREVCIPTEATSSVVLPAATEADALAEARLAQYRRRLPTAPIPGRLDVEAVTAGGTSLMIDVRMPDSAHADLFAEPPSGWYLGQPELVSRFAGVSHYRLELDGKPREATIAGQSFRFVATAGGEAIEEIVDFP